MKRINSKYDLVKNVKKYKREEHLLKTIGKYPAIHIILYPLLLALSSSFSIFFVVLALHIIAVSLITYIDLNHDMGSHYKKISKLVKKATGKKIIVDDIMDVQIIPKNIKMGESLDSRNIVDIYKKGYYVLVPTYGSTIVFRQFYLTDEEKQMEEEKDFTIEKLEPYEYHLALEQDEDIKLVKKFEPHKLSNLSIK